MENCKGCPGVLHHCLFIDHSKRFKCPCFICIVKVICEGTCDDFDDFMTRYSEGTENKTKRT
jgi:hypothetical protein